MNWSLMSHEERVRYLVNQAHRIAVRVELDGKWRSRFLTEIPSKTRDREMLRLAKRDIPPVLMRDPDDED